MTALTFGLKIAQSVTEEKQTRVVEILVATIPVRALLAGKVIGGAVLAFGQIALIAAGDRRRRAPAPGNSCCSTASASPAWFVLFFAVGVRDAGGALRGGRRAGLAPGGHR